MTTRSLAAELLLAPGAVADHAAPKQLPLVVARQMKLPREGEDESDRMFRHRAFIHALRIGQPYAALGEQRLVILIRAGAERLHEPQLRRARHQRVSPKTRYHQHISLARPPLQIFKRPHLKMRDARPARCEFFRGAIGDVREGDRERAAGRESRIVQRVTVGRRRRGFLVVRRRSLDTDLRLGALP